MSWLRLDDRFTQHPKFEGWTIPERWAWLEVMQYCARYETRGRIPEDLTLLPRSTTAKLLDKALAAGWCERHDSGSGTGNHALWINDWDEYNPPNYDENTLDEMVTAASKDHPQASANELARIIGGRRKDVLRAIKRFRDGSQNGSASGSDTGSRNHAGTGSRAGTRARPRPVPEVLTSGRDVALDVEAPPQQAAEPPGSDFDGEEPGTSNGRVHTEHGMRPDRSGTVGPGLKQKYDPGRGDTYVRNALVQVPAGHRRADLEEQFPDIPDGEVHRLLDFAADLAPDPDQEEAPA